MLEACWDSLHRRPSVGLREELDIMRPSMDQALETLKKVWGFEVPAPTSRSYGLPDKATIIRPEGFQFHNHVLKVHKNVLAPMHFTVKKLGGGTLQ